MGTGSIHKLEFRWATLIWMGHSGALMTKGSSAYPLCPFDNQIWLVGKSPIEMDVFIAKIIELDGDVPLPYLIAGLFKKKSVEMRMSTDWNIPPDLFQ